MSSIHPVDEITFLPIEYTTFGVFFDESNLQFKLCIIEEQGYHRAKQGQVLDSPLARSSLPPAGKLNTPS